MRTLYGLSQSPWTEKAIWENVKVAGDFEDLLEWRDALYAKHRPGG